MKVGVTGHRHQRLNRKEVIVKNWLYNQLVDLREREPITAAYTGMAQGVDQIFALQCFKLNVPYYCVFPYKRSNFCVEETFIIERAAGSMALQNNFSLDCYYKRDCFIVNNCDVLIAVWDGIPQGGTYITVDYARKQGKPIIYCPREMLLTA